MVTLVLMLAAPSTQADRSHHQARGSGEQGFTASGLVERADALAERGIRQLPWPRLPRRTARSRGCRARKCSAAPAVTSTACKASGETARTGKGRVDGLGGRLCLFELDVVNGGPNAGNNSARSGRLARALPAIIASEGEGTSERAGWHCTHHSVTHSVTVDDPESPGCSSCNGSTAQLQQDETYLRQSSATWS